MKYQNTKQKGVSSTEVKQKGNIAHHNKKNGQIANATHIKCCPQAYLPHNNRQTRYCGDQRREWLIQNYIEIIIVKVDTSIDMTLAINSLSFA